MSTITITGAGGHLGRRTAELLLEAGSGHDVVLVTRRPEALADLAARGAEVRFGDFDDVASLDAAFAGADRLLLVSTDVVGARLAGHLNAVAAAARAGVELVAYTSVPNPDVERNVATVVPDHAATEAALRESGVGWTFLRNAMYSEFRFPELEGALASGSFVHNQGDGTNAYVSREDCAAAAVAVLLGGPVEHGGKAYDITGAESFGGDDLAALFSAVGGGREVAAVRVDDEAFAAGLASHGLPEHVVAVLTSVGRATREGALSARSEDVAALLGRAPITLRAVLEQARVATA